ncbi:MAG: biosynthetic arginine decarboxylase [Phycisphaerales bacterium]
MTSTPTRPPLTPPTAHNPAHANEWSLERSIELYGLNAWPRGYFRAGDNGHVHVTPLGANGPAIDLIEIMQGLEAREVYPPVLLRFSDILESRLNELSAAFKDAIAKEGYAGGYSCVYPIKVNQQRLVVEEVRDAGAKHGFGLEAGSKPELLAVLGLTANHPDMPIVCNGFKDSEFIEAIILATKLGRNIIPIVEKATELELIVHHAERHGVRPRIGLRAKLLSKGVGRWRSSAGPRSKFGLQMTEILSALDYLKSHGMADCLNLLHFHIGSQVFDIRGFKNAVTELAHIYTELRRLGAGMKMLDIGGGLAVDYDGTGSTNDSSMNYTIAEYAADVIYRIKAVCDDAGVPHPDILSESGRAMVSYSSMLVFDVTGSSTFDVPPPASLEAAIREAEVNDESEVPQPLVDLYTAFTTVNRQNIREVYHDATQARDELMSLFGMGYVSLPLRAIGERVYWAIARAIVALLPGMDDVPEELADLPDQLADHYFCNLSIFQSLPDFWAIDQKFPICPIHRLNEQPTRRAVLHDLTCDSDGQLDCFISPDGERRTLPVHPLRSGERYYLGVFLIGAYQEILGDLHNLFGDTHAVHISINEDGEAGFDEIVYGESVADVLRSVEIDPTQLRRDMRREVEKAVQKRRLTAVEAGRFMRFYEGGLEGYTYYELD